MNASQATLLDAMRVVAAQMVLIGHIYSIVLVPTGTLGIGDLGVVIFFVLSGFLIVLTTLQRLSRSDYGLKVYLIDRLCRVFVPYLPALLCILAMDTVVVIRAGENPYADYYKVKHFVGSLLMLQQHPFGLFFDEILGLSALKIATFGSARPLWTVAIEWWLYVCFGLVLFRCGQPTRAPWALLLLVLPVPLFNMVAGTGQGLSLLWCLSGGARLAVFAISYRFASFGAQCTQAGLAQRAGARAAAVRRPSCMDWVAGAPYLIRKADRVRFQPLCLDNRRLRHSIPSP